jgi:hypothetical protein
VPGLHRNHRRANPFRLTHQCPGRDAEALGFVAGGDRAGRIGHRLDDDDRLPTQGRIVLLFAQREEGVEIEEQPLDGVVGRLICSLFALYDRRLGFSSPTVGIVTRRWVCYT